MSASKDKGTKFETAIVRYLNAEGFLGAERRALAGDDCGDISGFPGWVIEAKNCARTDLGAWVDEAEREQVNAGAEFGVVWHHRRGKASPADGFVTMSGAAFVRLLREVTR